MSYLAAAYILALGALIAQPDRSLTYSCGYGRGGDSVMEILDAVDRATNSRIDRFIAPRRVGVSDPLVSDPFMSNGDVALATASC